MERAVAWVRSLKARSFIGTESRLNTVFELLRQMWFGAESDVEARLEELKGRRLELDEEIARFGHGEVSVLDRAGLSEGTPLRAAPFGSPRLERAPLVRRRAGRPR